MKKSYDVRWSETSENDLITIVQYIADDSPYQAYEIFKEIKKRATSLRVFPDRGRIVPELLEQGLIQYRELIIALMADHIPSFGGQSLRPVCAGFPAERRGHSSEKTYGFEIVNLPTDYSGQL